jgi:pimeloyl-ACP methyl ester carboxylesterase
MSGPLSQELRYRWTHIAATFAEHLRVLAIDLSGHGDSGHRSAYVLEQWTDEVMTAIRTLLADSDHSDPHHREPRTNSTQ